MHSVSPLVPSRRMPAEQARATLTHVESAAWGNFLAMAGWRRPPVCGASDFPERPEGSCLRVDTDLASLPLLDLWKNLRSL